MKYIDLYDAFELIRLCDGLILEDKILEPSLIGIENDPENEFLYLHWSEDIRGEIIDFTSGFQEKDNQEILVDGPYITLINTDGQEEELMLLKAWDVEDNVLFETNEQT